VSLTQPALPAASGRFARGAIRVMIVDDSRAVRSIFRCMIESDPALVLAGSVSSAERAIAQLAAAPADVVLLDFAMSGMGGLQALPAILATPAPPRVLVVSSLRIDGAVHSRAALRMGTADTPPKPRPGGFTEDYRTQLLGKIRALGSRTRPDGLDVRKMAQRALAHPEPATRRVHQAEVVAIGAKTGGIHALGLKLGAIEPGCDLPILITQHLPPL